MFLVKVNDLFWNGKGFSEEFPDAKLYRDIEEALLEASSASRKAKDKANVIENYGFSYEKIVFTTSIGLKS